MKIEELTQEQIEKAKSLATDEELLAYLKECGVELDDDMLAEIAGGGEESPAPTQRDSVNTAKVVRITKNHTNGNIPAELKKSILV